jgi:hypothetical protein
LERRSEGMVPWRIPYQDAALYPPSAIEMKAAICAGVRLRFRTDSTTVVVSFSAIDADARVDGRIDEAVPVTMELKQGDTEARFSALPVGWKEIEVYLPQNIGMTIHGLDIDSDAQLEAWADDRPRWVTYGSSITQCVDAASPSRTWPALVAQRSGYNLTCLGFSGNCHLEPMVGRLIRELPASLISLCVGINVYGAASLSSRSFKPALIGMLQTIREKHVHTPILVISPIYAPEREVKPNPLGFTLPIMRRDVQETVRLFRERGDDQLYYMNGLELLGPEHAHHLPDGLHPDAHGYEIMAKHFEQYVAAAIGR